MTKPVFRSGIYGALLAFSLVPAAVTAAEERLEYSLSAGATHTDNGGRTGSNKHGATSADAGLTAGIEFQRVRSALTLDANLAYRTSLSGNYGEELGGGLAASTTYRFTPHFSWAAEDNLGQSLVVGQNPGSPGNTQTVNMFSTGPQLAIPLRQSTSLSLQGRWSDVSYSKNSANNSRSLSATLGVQQRLGEHSSLSLNGSTSRFSYSALPSSSEFETRSASLKWSATGARTTLNMSAGHTSVDEGLGQSSGGVTYSLGLTRKIAARSTFSLDAGRSFGDAADALRREQVITGVSADGQPVFISAGPAKSDYATASLDIPRNRSSLTLSANWRREGQRGVALDRDSYGASLGVSRRVNERFSLNLSSNYTRQHFDASSARFDDWIMSIGMNWAFRPTFSTSATWSHRVGNGDTALGAGTRNYTENSISVRLNWSPRS